MNTREKNKKITAFINGKKKSNSYTWKYLENLKGDGVGGAFVAEL
jgi:hypothetical protein